MNHQATHFIGWSFIIYCRVNIAIEYETSVETKLCLYFHYQRYCREMRHIIIIMLPDLQFRNKKTWIENIWVWAYFYGLVIRKFLLEPDDLLTLLTRTCPDSKILWNFLAPTTIWILYQSKLCQLSGFKYYTF